MTLVDLWRKDKASLKEKTVQQVIAFAGDGRLTDNSSASSEFREYLGLVPLTVLSDYCNQCLKGSFPDSGLALQDLVNEVAGRIGFAVERGLYRGRQNQIGFDGIWTGKSGHSIVVEVKTTDAYRINLEVLEKYRRRLIDELRCEAESSSILLVVGREDTGELEAQIRGSRYAWTTRIIGVDALLRLGHLRLQLEDPSVISRIHNALVPYEFTRLDRIIDIAFAAVEDEQDMDANEQDEDSQCREKKFTPSAFHDECMERVSDKLGMTFVKQSKASFKSEDGATKVLCAVSAANKASQEYWFAFHRYQDEFLTDAKVSYVAFGCGSAEVVFLIPFQAFKPLLSRMYTTSTKSRSYWHVKIVAEGDSWQINTKSGKDNFDINEYLLGVG